MTRLRGRSPKGRRLHASAPCGRWRATTMVGSIRQSGETACMTIDGAMNAGVFRVYVREVLLPTLSPGGVLVMDNLSAHKGRQAIGMLKRASVIVRFLPAYSPDYNPIELMWSKVKSILRKIEARTNEALLLAIGSALAEVTAKDATNWLAH